MGYKIIGEKTDHRKIFKPLRVLINMGWLTRKAAEVGTVAGLAAFLAGPEEVRGQEAEMKTVPQPNIWIADGTTVYEVQGSRNNDGLEPDGARTDVADWIFLKPADLNNPGDLNFISASVPSPANDFYDGIEMFADDVRDPGLQSTREVKYMLTGPGNHSGYLGTYRFTVPLGTPRGLHKFRLSNPGIWGEIPGPSWGEQDRITPTPNEEFKILTCDDIDLNGDQQHTLHDLAAFTTELGPSGPGISPPGVYDADFDEDGDVDLADFSTFQRGYTCCKESAKDGPLSKPYTPPERTLEEPQEVKSRYFGR